MRVLVLSWDPLAGDGGLDPQAAGLAVALAAAGADVRLVTRLGEGCEGRQPPALPGVEVHAVTDAPPILPAQLDGPVLAAQAFATRAMSVVARRVRERAVDVVHAVGWQTQPVVAALRAAHGVPVAAVLTRSDVATDRPTAVRASARQLAADADVLLAPTHTDQQALHGALGVAARVLPPGTDLPARSPGPPPAAGPLHLVAGPGQDHRAVARGIREAAEHRRRITRGWRRRPFAVAVLDPGDVTTAVRAMALGVPLVATAGPVGELASATGGGLLADPTAAAIAAVADRLAADPDLAAVVGARGAAAATHHAWTGVAAAWRRAVAPVAGGPGLRLHAVTRGRPPRRR